MAAGAGEREPHRLRVVGFQQTPRAAPANVVDTSRQDDIMGEYNYLKGIMGKFRYLLIFCMGFSLLSPLAVFSAERKQTSLNTALLPNGINTSLQQEKHKTFFLINQNKSASPLFRHIHSLLAQYALTPCICYSSPPPANSSYDTRCPSGLAANVPCPGNCALQPGKYAYQYVCLPPRR